MQWRVGNAMPGCSGKIVNINENNYIYMIGSKATKQGGKLSPWFIKVPNIEVGGLMQMYPTKIHITHIDQQKKQSFPPRNMAFDGSLYQILLIGSVPRRHNVELWWSNNVDGWNRKSVLAQKKNEHETTGKLGANPKRIQFSNYWDHLSIWWRIFSDLLTSF